MHVCTCVHVYLLFVVAQRFLGVWTPENALLYCITCAVGSFFKTGSFEPVSLYADPKFVRVGPGGVGGFKLGA